MSPKSGLHTIGSVPDAFDPLPMVSVVYSCHPEFRWMVSMVRAQIEDEARRLRYEIWHQRAVLFPMGVPPQLAMYDPAIAARVLHLEYERRERIGSINGVATHEAAGILNRKRGIISISTRFDFAVQRFTGGHEIGHFLLHPELGDTTVHRDLPVFQYGTINRNRPREDREADYFAACFLAPRDLLIEEFEKRFGPHPLWLNEHVAFHLRGDSASDLFVAPHGALVFPAAVAGAHKFDRRHFPSLAEHFGISVSAMAIRLRELELVRE